MNKAQKNAYWKSTLQLGVDHYSGMFELVEAAAHREHLKMFLLVGKRAVSLVKFVVATGVVTHERQATDSALSDTIRRAAELQAEREARFEHVLADCGELAFDVVIIMVGLAAGGAGGGALLYWKRSSAVVKTLQCAVAFEAYQATAAGHEAFVDTPLGQQTMVVVDGLDTILTIVDGARSLRNVARADRLLRAAPLRHNLGDMRLHEAAKLAIVHLPTLVLKSGNLLDRAHRMTPMNDNDVLGVLASRVPAPIVWDHWSNVEFQFSPFIPRPTLLDGVGFAGPFGAGFGTFGK